MIGDKRDNLGGTQHSGILVQEVSGTGQNRVIELRRARGMVRKIAAILPVIGSPLLNVTMNGSP